ncbi:MAG TPA: endonuclease V [Candidatus Nanoarchaeia archaeon]|nr:endonuclease V [Candidatus Nanoarchaeia archaeon]
MDYKPRFNTKKLEEEQARLSRKIIAKDDIDFSQINTIAGFSQAFFGRKIISAVVICDAKTMDIVEKKYAIIESKIPYIPGFLGFRESPAIIEAYSKLSAEPDVIMIEGHGVLHPRKFGFASQAGLSLDKPSIGIAKSLLTGEVSEGDIFVDGELRGKELRTKEHANPLYISAGHLISLKTAVEIVKNCINPPHKLPEPLHIAGRYADKIREREVKNDSENSKFIAESPQKESPQKKAAGMLFNF